MKSKNYGFAKDILEDGIQYGEERDLDSCRSNMLSHEARTKLKTGDWTEADSIAETFAQVVYEKMKQEMRTSGIKSIPSGIRRTPRANAAYLTGRELNILQLLKEG